MTMANDLANYEAHARLLEVAKSVDSKVAKIQANRDIKVARANSMSQDTRIARYVAIAAVFILMSIGGCSAYVFGGPENTELELQRDRNQQERYTQCIDAGGDWSSRDNDCNLPDN